MTIIVGAGRTTYESDCKVRSFGLQSSLRNVPHDMILLFQQASLLALGTVFPGAISLVAALLAHSPISSKARPSSSSFRVAFECLFSSRSLCSFTPGDASHRTPRRTGSARTGRRRRADRTAADTGGACDGVIVCSCPARPARHRLTPSR